MKRVKIMAEINLGIFNDEETLTLKRITDILNECPLAPEQVDMHHVTVYDIDTNLITKTFDVEEK